MFLIIDEMLGRSSKQRHYCYIFDNFLHIIVNFERWKDVRVVGRSIEFFDAAEASETTIYHRRVSGVSATPASR